MYAKNTRDNRSAATEQMQMLTDVLNDTAQDTAGLMDATEETAADMCTNGNGSLPAPCAPLAFPYVPMQGENARRYGQQEALRAGTLFPGLNLPFHRELETRFPALNTALSELMALDFAIDELGLYLTTHRNDEDALELFWSYIRLANEGREKYVATYGPLRQTDFTAGGFRWLDDPWPWEKGGND